MMRLGKGEGRFEVGGSFGVGVGVGVGVEQLRNGGCLSVPSSYQTGRGSKHEPSFTGQASGWAGGLISNLTCLPPPLQSSKPFHYPGSNPRQIGSRTGRAEGCGNRATTAKIGSCFRSKITSSSLSTSQCQPRCRRLFGESMFFSKYQSEGIRSESILQDAEARLLCIEHERH
jgi:hypothetical protein